MQYSILLGPNIGAYPPFASEVVCSAHFRTPGPTGLTRYFGHELQLVDARAIMFSEALAKLRRVRLGCISVLEYLNVQLAPHTFTKFGNWKYTRDLARDENFEYYLVC